MPQQAIEKNHIWSLGERRNLTGLSLSTDLWTPRVLCLAMSDCNILDYSWVGSSVHGISQARLLEWVAMSSSKGSSQPRDQTSVFCIAGGFFTAEPQGKPNMDLTPSCKMSYVPDAGNVKMNEIVLSFKELIAYMIQYDSCRTRSVCVCVCVYIYMTQRQKRQEFLILHCVCMAGEGFKEGSIEYLTR